MSADADVIIIGSGPAGVSAAFPLVEAGLKVLLVDGGKQQTHSAPSTPYLNTRAEDKHQWEWMVGKNFHALQQTDAISPKLRIPNQAYVFEDFIKTNQIEAQQFVAIGSLAQGGLSNAWGCGVARLSSNELSPFPFSPVDIEASYAAVTQRMGVSGAVADDLSDYFGLDAWADSPIPMDRLHSNMLSRYTEKKLGTAPLGFKLGHSRVAALSQHRGERQACNLSGNCMWGCERRALYSAREDLTILKQYTNFIYKPGFIVDQITHDGALHAVEGSDVTGLQKISATKIVLAAGTLATTRLALHAMKFNQPVTMQTCPTAAFMLWLPMALGSVNVSAFGLGQLSFTLSLSENISGFGSLLNTSGIPVAEFLRYLPFRKRYGIDLLKTLLSSCVAGNFFLPGHLTQATLSLREDGALCIEGKHQQDVAMLMQDAQKRLRKIFLKMGAVLLPKSFTIGKVGSDIHYACSLPMRADPKKGETDAWGELAGLSGVHIVDGACLSSLTEKFHTLTIMANADRIAKKIAKDFNKLNKI